VKFEIDLSEGIDLSLFLFGKFQSHVYKNRLLQLPEDAVIFDIGANIGSICLPLACSLPHSSVYAFEPTDYAFTKLKRNIELNVQLGSRIRAIQAFVSSEKSSCSQLVAFSSWKMTHSTETKHPVHGGTPKEATKQQTTIDDFVIEHDISKLDFLKIDTDGYEFEVLNGAVGSLRRFRPFIVFELMLYALEEKGLKYSDFESLLFPMGYRFLDAQTGQTLKQSNIEKVVPRNGGIDVLALPRG
jgi:FkbM family methyltransferase